MQNQFLPLRQGDSSIDDYTLEFRTLAATSGWNEAAILSAFLLGLNPCICTQMQSMTTTWDWKVSSSTPPAFPNALSPVTRTKPHTS